jgi:hypothetical protein
MSEELNNQVVADFYIEDQQVKEVVADENTTPLGDTIFKVTLADDSVKLLTRAKFEAIKTTEKSTATDARNALTREIGQKIYAIMCEYGLLMSEIDPVLNETVRLVNDNQNHALDIMWGVEAYDRSLLHVNRVLLEKYDPAQQQEVDPGADEPAPVGGSTDTADKE